MAVKVFICYAREDETLLQKLTMHLRLLQRQGLIETWHNRDISAGAVWEQEIQAQFNSAHLILVLVSPDFIDSNYCYGIEMQQLIKRHERNEVQVIPIILRPVYWYAAPFGKLHALPTDAKPITSSHWHNWDEAFFDVVEGVRTILAQRQESKALTIQDRGSEEKLSRAAILAKLFHVYVLSHDIIRPGILAGTEPLPKAWVEEQLEKMGEAWRQDVYYGKAMELSEMQLLFIQSIFDYFHEQGTWPTYGYIEREISHVHPNFDMRGVSRSLPSGFANAFASHSDRKQEAILKVPAILLCKGSEHDLTDFVQTLRYCVNKYLSAKENLLPVTSDEVGTQLHMSALSLRKVGQLIEGEGMVWSSLMRNDIQGTWVCTFRPGIVRFQEVETIEQYVEKLDRDNTSLLVAQMLGQQKDSFSPVSMSSKDTSPQDDGENALLTVHEVARQLRVDDITVRRWIKNGVLEAVTLPHRGARQAYRVRRSTLNHLLSAPPVREEDSQSEVPSIRAGDTS